MTDLQKNAVTIALMILGGYLGYRFLARKGGILDRAGDSIVSSGYDAVSKITDAAGNLWDDLFRGARNTVTGQTTDLLPYFMLNGANQRAQSGGRDQLYYTTATDAVQRNAQTNAARKSDPNAGFMLSPATSEAAAAYAAAVRASLGV